MGKWMRGSIIGLTFLLQGCSSYHEAELLKLQKDSEIMSVELNEQLLQAAAQGEVSLIQDLLSKDIDINVQDANKRTAVMLATYNNDVEMATMLIEAGADVNIQDDRQNNPFLYAGAEGYLEILKLTITAGADPSITNRYGGTALIPASEHGYIDVIQELLTTTEVDVNHVNNLGWTALMEAIILNDGRQTQQQVVQLLIDYGADVNIPDNKNISPLQHAQAKDFHEILQLLKQAGAK
ncbi:ankyrin repeat protein [Lysinibacillus parviboronicapiens]|uniref:Ankyrin repeat protein n=1 Tax=Lysinibacillus parviboronicapiens TaxID=436516 RepID=A0ABV2PHZ5_9BACI